MKAQWTRQGLVAILALSLIGGMAVAQQEPVNQPGQTPQSLMAFQPKLEKAKDLIGAKVINRDGTRLGSIEDIVLTPQRDAISYVALSYGGIMGVGGKLLAVPWSAFEVRPQEQGKVVVLNVDENYLRTAKGFDKDNWPLTADKSWPGISSGNVSGEQPRSGMNEGMAAEPRGDQTYTPQANERMEQGTAPMARSDELSKPISGSDIKYLRLSQLIGTPIKNSEGVQIGKLNNVMLDINAGKVAYGILSLDRSLVTADKNLAAIPWSAIRIDPQQKTALLNVDKETLQAVAFDENHFPNLADPQYGRDLYQRFNARPYWETFGFVPSEQHEHQGMMTPGASTNTPNESLGQIHHERSGCE